MPVIIAQLLRTVVMALISAIPLTLAQELVDGTAKKLVDVVSDEEGLTTEESKDIISNVFIDLAINATVVGAVMKTKVALKTADFLGFSTRGFVKKQLTGKAAQVSAKLATSGGASVVKATVPSLWKFFGAITGGIWLVNAIANTIEVGIYKPAQANAVYKKLGIPFQYPITESQLQPGPFDGQQFKDYANSLEQIGVKGFNDPFALQSRPYSRQALADLIEGVYGREIINGNAPSAKQLIPLLAPYIISDKKTTATTVTTPATTTAKPYVVPVKVFVGTVSQGYLGNQSSFTPRENDLIESTEELKTSAHNNLVPFLASLPGKVTYDLRIVSSVVTSDGFRKYGTTQKIISGYNQNGTPKYKTVTNKFAVLDLYIKTATGGRTKLQTVVLGPVDSVQLQINAGDLASLASGLSVDIVTNQLSEISNINTSQNLSSAGSLAGANGSTSAPATPIQQTIQITPRDYFVNYDSFYTQVFYVLGDSIVASPEFDSLLSMEERQKLGNKGEMTRAGIERLKQMGVDVSIYPHKIFHNEIGGKLAPMINTKSFEEFFGASGLGGQTATPDTATPELLQAKTLFEFYSAKGEKLPTVTERGVLYESLGLGPASYYVGTAEQNTKLLNKLQGK